MVQHLQGDLREQFGDLDAGLRVLGPHLAWQSQIAGGMDDEGRVYGRDEVALERLVGALNGEPTSLL